ncbi:hypothetical protein [Mucilaginibacter sp. OK098]|uniref:hypothetical protein n=1 Tax=Mucilaginibacter sp. OK098 TaxID=1855297 RepID=UPI0009137D3B|nr:hypothetical protein [Mucilaginibacter sp. OK098]SHN10702.1 hypothetical protein SAMN05216524_105254 [Mucilaginibacter sp. OK098]
MSLLDCLNNYRNSIAEANSFLAMAFQKDSTGSYLLQANQRNFITDSSFLKMFIAWETFIESAFLNYMLGELSINGNSIIRYVQPLDYAHANKILIGTQKYVDWSNPEIIKRLSNLYFKPSNIIDTYISSAMTDLFDLKTIRNAAAHLTSTTQTQIVSLGNRLLNINNPTLTVSDLILSFDPMVSTSVTVLTSYLTKLDILAEGIANG